MFSDKPKVKLEEYKLSALERTAREEKNLKVGVSIEGYRVHKTSKMDLFTTFTHHSLTKSLSTGWKIHLSVSPQELNMVYPLIVPILVQYGVLQFKFSDIPLMEKCLKTVKRVEFLESTKRLHDGMQVTIYIKDGQEASLNPMLEEIQTALLNHNITPGLISDSDRPLSQFVSVRHQGVEEYLDSQDTNSYNPTGQIDHFEELNKTLTTNHTDKP